MSFIVENEIAERSIRRLADSRDCTVAKNGSEYQIFGAGISGVTLSDDEAWEILSALPQVRNRRGR